MSVTLPNSIDEVEYLEWETYRPIFEELIEREISAENQRQWLEDWSHLTRLLREAASWTYIQKTLDTSDKDREAAYLRMVETVVPEAAKADQILKERLLTLEIDDPDMQIMLRNLRSEVDLFREANLPIATELTKLATKYDKRAGGFSAEFDGETKNLSKLGTHLDSSDRDERERAWHAIMGLWQDARPEFNDIYSEMVKLRQQQAENAGLANQREYAFIQRKRFAYTPDDCAQFHDAIEAAFVPAAQRIMERKRELAGYDTLRPWDWVPEMGKVLNPSSAAPLRPFATEDELIAGSLRVFNQLDPQLGRYFASMADNGLLDLMTRPGKSMGGYCSGLPLRKSPFIFMNATGSARNLKTMFHEAGHAFHGFEAMANQPLVWQQRAPMEFNEVASMAMELLVMPWMTKDKGGFFTEEEVAQANREHFEKIILFMPFMAIVDAFQHWVYTHPGEAQDASNLDAKWDELWQRFLPGVDWTGYEEMRKSGWQRKLHIFRYPFYYIEYGMAQIGALQVWRNSLTDHPKALADYRAALSAGGTRTLPELFETAGTVFRFDADFITTIVDKIHKI